MTEKPLWLSTVGIRELLNLLVDRLDSSEQRGSTTSKSVPLTQRTWPALHMAQFESLKEELWGHVIEMSRWGWLQVKPASAVQSASGYAVEPRVLVLNAMAVRTVVNRPERIKSSTERWRIAVEDGLDVKSRLFINAFNKKVWFLALPVLEGLHG